MWILTQTWKMPASGIPQNLQLILETLLDKCKLRSWQVQSDKQGCYIRIRFTSPESVQDEGLNNITGSYVKKTPSQLKRDRNRSTQHVSDKRLTRAEARRQEGEHDIEIARSSGETTSHCPATCVIDTPVHVADPHKAQQSMSTPHLNDLLNINNHTTPELSIMGPLVQSPVSEAEPPEISLPQSIVEVGEDTSEDEQSSDSDCECDPKMPPGCFNDQCSYGGGPGSRRTAVGLYTCRRCNIDVCQECYDEGTAHMGHRKYLKKKAS